LHFFDKSIDSAIAKQMFDHHADEPSVALGRGLKRTQAFLPVYEVLARSARGYGAKRFFPPLGPRMSGDRLRPRRWISNDPPNPRRENAGPRSRPNRWGAFGAARNLFQKSGENVLPDITAGWRRAAPNARPNIQMNGYPFDGRRPWAFVPKISKSI